MDGNPFQESPAGERSDAIVQLYAAECAIRRTMLRVVAAHDRAESWKEDGATSMAAWLVAQLGVAYGTAARMVSTGNALENLDHVAEVFAEGRLSWDKAHALSKVATADTDQTLTEQALGLSASQVQTLTRRIRSAVDTEADRSRRSVRKWWDSDGQWFNLRARIPGSDGAIVEKAIERAVRHVPRSVRGQIFEPLEMRQADALVEIASTRLGTDPDPDRSSVVVHVDLETLTTAIGTGEIDRGPFITADTARRLACDARLQMVLDGANGLPVGIGRTSRTIPAWLNRQIRRRDRSCRFPGCERTRWVQAHHLVHWAAGGPTDLDNLVTLCGYHHRLVHEAGWTIEGCPNGDLVFIRPDGLPYQPRLDGLRPEVRRRLVQPVLESRPAYADTS